MLDDLILVRLLPGGRRPPMLPQVARDLSPMFRRPLDVERVRVAVDGLRARGEIAPGRLAPTDAGRARALRFLGLDALPARCTWRTLKARALPSKALGLPPADRASARVLGSEERLAARLLQQRFSLPPGAGDDLGAALQALVCRELGHPDCATLDELAAAVMSRRIGADRPLSPAVVRKQAPRVLLDVPGGIEALREQVLAGWADAAEPTLPEPAPVDDAALALEILAAARGCATGRFGLDKVLVHHVWHAVHGRPALPVDLDGFKQLLVSLNGAGRLALARADLVQLMDPHELARAEIRVGHATFHFVRSGASRQ
jgi:hypothetical protein